MTVGARLKISMDNKELTPYKLHKGTGVSQSTIGRILKDESVSNRSTLQSLSDFLEVDVEWLMKGEIVSAKKHQSDAIRVDYKEMSVMYVPLVNHYAYAGYTSGHDDPEFIEELPKIPFANDREHKGEYICFEVKGDSMDDGSHESYLERDILLCRNVRKDYWKSKLHINKWDFVIVHQDRGICVKRIIKHDVENGIITCHSFNDYYEDFDLDLREVSQIFNIVDVQRKRNRR